MIDDIILWDETIDNSVISNASLKQRQNSINLLKYLIYFGEKMYTE